METTISVKSAIKKNILNFNVLNKALLFTIIILGVYFIAGSNDLAIKGYALSELKGQKTKLMAANNKLELTALSLSSFANIKDKVSDLNMVAAGEVSYLTVGAGIVAKK